MKTPRISGLVVALSMVVALAACGGQDSSSRDRNAALEGKQQCLSDDASSVTDAGEATLAFCDSASTYVVVASDGTESEPAPVGDDGTATYKAKSSLDVVRIKSFDTTNELVGEDLVTVTLPSCAGGAACVVGDTGPGGGVVLYDAGSTQPWGRYIEMARPGWYDGTTGAESPSADPVGNFGCESQFIGTSLALGTAADNMSKWYKDCDTVPGYGQRAYTLVKNFNDSNITPVNNWVIPSWRDLFKMHTAPLALLETVVPRGSISTSTEDPNSSASQMCLYSYVKFWESSSVAAQDNYYNLVTYSCSSVTRKLEYNNFVVRPVHYFDSTGAGKATLTIVGQMDIPVPPTTVETTTTTVAPDVVPAPSGESVNVSTDNEVVVSWNADENADAISDTQVTYKADGVDAVVVKSTTATTAVINASAFAEGKEYTFQVQRVGKSSGETVNGIEMPFVPVPAVVASTSTVPEETTTTLEETTSTPDESTSTVPEETTTTLEETTTTAGETNTTAAESGEMTLEEKFADCGKAPVVTFDKKEVEKSGVLEYSVKWKCFEYMNGESFGQAAMHSFEDGTRNQVYVYGEGLKSQLTGDTYTYSAPVGAGSYTVNINVSYSGTDHGWYSNTYFDPFRASFNISSAVAGSFRKCSPGDIKIANDELSMDCTVTGVLQLRLEDEWKFLNAKDGVIDLSTLPEGWTSARLTVGSGATEFFVDGVYCSRKCNTARTTLKAERTVGEDNYWTFKVTRPSWCVNPVIAWTEGKTYNTVTRGVREENWPGQNFYDKLEFGLIVDPSVAMVRVGSGDYWCYDSFGQSQTASLYADYFQVEETDGSSPTTMPSSDTTVLSSDTTAVAPSPMTTVVGPVIQVPTQAFVPPTDGQTLEIQVPSNAPNLGVSAASLETVLSNAGTTVPVVLATFDNGDRAVMRRGRDSVLRVPDGAKSVTFTAFKKDGTKVETTANLVTTKPLVTVAIKSSGEGGGFPLVPAVVALVVLAGAALFVQNRRKTIA